MDQDTLLNKLIQRCDYSHTVCKKTQADILKHCEKSTNANKLDNDFMLRYLITLETGHYDCLNNADRWLLAISKICEKCDPTTDVLLYAAKAGVYALNFFKMLIERGQIIDSSVLEAALTSMQNSSYGQSLVNYLAEHVDGDYKCLEIACMKNCHLVVSLLLKQKVRPTDKCLTTAIQNKNVALIETIIRSNPDVLSLDNIAAACASKNQELIQKIMGKTKITPDKKCYLAVFKDVCLYSRNSLYRSSYYKKTHTTKQQDNESADAEQVAEIIDILINFGYKLDYEDVVTALDHRCYINNISRFTKIKLDEAFLERCTLYDYCPYEDIAVKPTVRCLAIECGKGDISKVKKIIIRGVVPDISCLVEAVSCRKNNLEVIKLLIHEYNIEPNVACLKAFCNTISSSNLTALLTGFSDNEKIVIVEKIVEKDNTSNVKKIDIPTDHIGKTNMKENIKLKATAIKFFKIDPKESKRSFMDVRDILILYLKDNKLYKDNLITVDKKLAKLLKLEEGVTDFGNLNLLVSRCY